MATIVHLGQYTNLTWCWVSFTHSWNKDIIATASKKIPVKWGEALLSIGAHTHTHIQETSITAHIKADRLCMILSKLSSNQLLLILSICSYLQQFPTTAQHLTYHLPAVQRLHHSHLFRHVLRQNRRAPMQQSMQDFLSTLLSQCGNVGSL